MKHFIAILHLTFIAGTCLAQGIGTPHRCWDITIPPESHIPYRAIIPTIEVDSGTIVVEYAKQYLGTPYRYGGKTPAGFDCAGFARYVYLHFGHLLSPYSGGQYKQGHRIDNRQQLQPGDLVFFGGRHNRREVGHTGIVVENSPSGQFRFIHSATNGGVIISHSAEAYYAERYIGACRIL